MNPFSLSLFLRQACLVFTAGIALLASSVAFASDSVYQDSATGDWVFTVTNPDNAAEVKVWRYTPTNQFTPRIKQNIRWAGGKQFEYQYVLSNSKKSKQAIAYLWIDGADMVVPELSVPRPTDTASLTFPQLLDLETIRSDKIFDETLKFMRTPLHWTPSIRVDEKTQRGLFFGWFPKPTVANPDLAPGQTLKNTSILRPELPGVGLAKMQGDTQIRGRAVGLPETGPLAEAWSQIEANDRIYVPVLVPAVPLGQAYSAIVHAQELKKEINAWSSIDVATQEVVDRLKSHSDILIASLQGNDKKSARQAIIAMLTEGFGHHRGMSHRHFDEDEDEQDAHALPGKPVKWPGAKSTRPEEKSAAPAPLHRVAARALGFNLMYLLTRLEIGR